MNADTIIQNLTELRQQAIDASNLIEIEIESPSDDVINSITENGGKIGKSRWEQWCLSNNCNHNSHDAGTSYQTVFIPESWVLKDTMQSVHQLFNVSDDLNYITPIMIIPSKRPQLVWHHQVDHYAGNTHLSNQYIWEEKLKGD